MRTCVRASAVPRGAAGMVGAHAKPSTMPNAEALLPQGHASSATDSPPSPLLPRFPLSALPEEELQILRTRHDGPQAARREHRTPEAGV